jgi:hypothetical protein
MENWPFKRSASHRVFTTADETEGKPVQITGARWSGRVPRGPTMLHTFSFVLLGSIIICRLYRLTLLDHSQVPLQLAISISGLL